MRFFLATLTATLFLASCKKEKPVTPEVPVEKEATYHIFAGRDYSGTLMENTTAEVHLQLRVINYYTGEQNLVWDSILPVRRIVDFPLYNNKLEVTKRQPVRNSHQRLNASLSVIYRDGQYISQEGKSDEAGPAIRSVLLEANL